MLTTHNVPYALQHINDIFQEKKWRPFLCNDSGNFKEHSTSCILESEPSSCNRETLARKSGTEQIEIWQVLGIDFSKVAIIFSSFRTVDGLICFCSIRINFSVSDTLKMTGCHQTGMETSDS